MLLITSAIPRAYLLAILLVGGAQSIRAQAFLHVDAESYLKERTADPNKPIGEPVGDFVDLYPNMGQWTLLFEKNGEKRKVKCKDIWGFTYKGILFRINDEGPLPVRLMVEASICYYENGLAHLIMQRDSTEFASVDLGHAAYLSKDIKGAIVPAIFKEEDTRSLSGRFRTEYPQLEALFKCIGVRNEMDPIRQCVVDFEAGLLGNN